MVGGWRAIEREGLDGYPALDSITEKSLLYGYRGIKRRKPPEPRERPVTGFYDESGLAYGEPISKGRTGLPEGDRT